MSQIRSHGVHAAVPVTETIRESVSNRNLVKFRPDLLPLRTDFRPQVDRVDDMIDLCRRVRHRAKP